MLQQSLFLFLFFTLISSSLCGSSFQDEPLANLVEHTPGSDPSAYPSVFGTIDKDRPANDLEASFTSLQMKYEADQITESRRYDHLGTPGSSPGEVSVEDFRAEGYGESDDTEVP